MTIPYIYRQYVIPAGAGMDVIAKGNFYRLLSATAQVNVAVSGAEPEPLPVAVGVPVPDGFSRLRVENPNGAAVTVEIAIGKGAITDNRLAVTGAIGVEGGGAQMEPYSETVVSNAAVLILPANANRTGAVIQAGSADLWLGPDNTVLAGTVPTIPTGQSLSVGHKGDVYAIRAVAGALQAGAYEEVK